MLNLDVLMNQGAGKLPVLLRGHLNLGNKKGV